MAKYIDKSALVAEIKKKIRTEQGYSSGDAEFGYRDCAKEILSFLDTLEVKEIGVDLGDLKGDKSAKYIIDTETLEVKEIENDSKFECPNIKIKDAIEVSSRMKYIDEDLKPIAEFIMDYCSWNLHKDEWSQPTIEVPLFRVLDALAQRGKPYCCG